MPRHRGTRCGIEGEGTIHWTLEDDNGRTHKLVLRNALFIPESPKCILSPQAMAQTLPGPEREHTTLLQMHDRAIFRWGSRGQYV